MTPAAQSALLTACRAQIDPKTGHTFDCGHMRQTFGGVNCIGQCAILREALAMIEAEPLETGLFAPELLTPVGNASPGSGETR